MSKVEDKKLKERERVEKLLDKSLKRYFDTLKKEFDDGKITYENLLRKAAEYTLACLQVLTPYYQ